MVLPNKIAVRFYETKFKTFMQPFFFRINQGKNDFITKAKKDENTEKDRNSED
jgi:hypothetical protein